MRTQGREEISLGALRRLVSHVLQARAYSRDDPLNKARGDSLPDREQSTEPADDDLAPWMSRETKDRPRDLGWVGHWKDGASASSDIVRSLLVDRRVERRRQDGADVNAG